MKQNSILLILIFSIFLPFNLAFSANVSVEKAQTVAVSFYVGLSSSIAESELQTYPNPSNGRFVITGSSHFDKVELIGSLCSLIQRIPINGQHHLKIDISGFQSGVYYLMFSNESQVLYKKLVKN